MFEVITKQAQTVVSELLDQAKLKVGSLFIIGCSSSEIVRKQIGRVLLWMQRRQRLKASIPTFRARVSIWLYSDANS